MTQKPSSHLVKALIFRQLAEGESRVVIDPMGEYSDLAARFSGPTSEGGS